MSLFGKLDAMTIPTNPFWIEAGDYQAEVTKAEYKTNRDDEKQLIIEFTITNEESDFHDKKATKYFTLVDSEMTQEAFAILPAEEKKNIRQRMAELKRMLCGNGAKQAGLGIDPNDLNDENWDPAVLVGKKVDLAISNYGPTNEGVNIRWANLSSQE